MALALSYCNSDKIYTAYYDEVNKTVQFSSRPPKDVAFDEPCVNPKNEGDTLYVDGDYLVIAKPSKLSYYATVEITVGEECLANITSVDVVNESYPGAADGSITINSLNASLLEYKIDTVWQASNVFTGLTNGSYDCVTRQTSSGCLSRTVTVEVGVNATLSASYTKTNLTASGANDGTITLTVINGSGTYTYLWSDAVTTKNRTGLAPGTYSVTITDFVTGDTFPINNITILDADPVVIPDIYFEVPVMQSISFSPNKETDSSSTLKTLDNVIYANSQTLPRFNGMCYEQKINQSDIITVQLRSNRNGNIIELINEDGEIVDTYTFTLINQYVSLLEQYSVRLQDHGDSKTRIYFIGESSIPLALSSGDTVEIVNNAEGFNGSYSILSIELDAVTSSQYLVINKLYNGAAASSNAEANFAVNTLDFNIYETVIDFSLVDTGYYYMKAYVPGEDVEYYSEPISVKVNHKKTHLIEFTNVDNAFDIDYSNNITHKVRVESLFYKRNPSVEKDTIRNTDNRLNTLSAKPQRKITFEAYNIPPYLVEKLAIATAHDVFKIQGVEFVAEEGTEEPEYKEGYGLASIRAIVEQKQWFSTYNGNDLGGIGIDQGFIIANEGYIKR